MRELIQEEITDMDGINCYITKGVLIRCKDCTHCEHMRIFGKRWCHLFDIVVKEYDYCSRAERKEE